MGIKDCLHIFGSLFSEIVQTKFCRDKHRKLQQTFLLTFVSTIVLTFVFTIVNVQLFSTNVFTIVETFVTLKL